MYSSHSMEKTYKNKAKQEEKREKENKPKRDDKRDRWRHSASNGVFTAVHKCIKQS